MTNDKMTDCRYVWRPLSFLSRRDNRTQPGVLTPGTDKESARPEGAEDIGSLVRSSMQALGPILYRPFRARPFWIVNPGLKPRAESCCPFGTRETRVHVATGAPDPVHSDGPNIVQIPIMDSTWKDLWSL